MNKTLTLTEIARFLLNFDSEIENLISEYKKVSEENRELKVKIAELENKGEEANEG